MTKVKYEKATIEKSDMIYNLVQNTIKTIYPKYYPKEVVDFFCNLHSKGNIKRDIEKGNVGILVVGDKIIGTGSYEENHITRVYIEPQYQGRGYGSYIMQCLEECIARSYDRACLDASLPASIIYEHRGYATIRHEKWKCENDVILVYEIMEKKL